MQGTQDMMCGKGDGAGGSMITSSMNVINDGQSSLNRNTRDYDYDSSDSVYSSC